MSIRLRARREAAADRTTTYGGGPAASDSVGGRSYGLLLAQPVAALLIAASRPRNGRCSLLSSQIDLRLLLVAFAITLRHQPILQPCARIAVLAA